MYGQGPGVGVVVRGLAMVGGLDGSRACSCDTAPQDATQPWPEPCCRHLRLFIVVQPVCGTREFNLVIFYEFLLLLRLSLMLVLV